MWPFRRKLHDLEYEGENYRLTNNLDDFCMTIAEKGKAALKLYLPDEKKYVYNFQLLETNIFLNHPSVIINLILGLYVRSVKLFLEELSISRLVHVSHAVPQKEY